MIQNKLGQGQVTGSQNSSQAARKGCRAAGLIGVVGTTWQERACIRATKLQIVTMGNKRKG